MELQSWDGSITNWYETQLGLKGGYSRKIHRALPSSIQNSEYVQELSNGLRVVARSGHKLPTPVLVEPHYNHPYGNPTSVSDMQRQALKREYNKQRKEYIHQLRGR